MGVMILSPKEAQQELGKYLLPADVVSERGQKPLAWAIRWLTKHRGEDKTYANHSAIVGCKKNIVEALFRVKSTPVTEWPLPDRFEVWRKSDLDLTQRVSIAQEAESFVGQFYGPLKIVPHFVDGLLGKVFGCDLYLARRLVFMKRYPICSWLVTWSYWQRVRYKFGLKPRMACPDVIHDWQKSHLGEWKLVAERGITGLVCVMTDEVK